MDQTFFLSVLCWLNKTNEFLCCIKQNFAQLTAKFIRSYPSKSLVDSTIWVSQYECIKWLIHWNYTIILYYIRNWYKKLTSILSLSKLKKCKFDIFMTLNVTRQDVISMVKKIFFLSSFYYVILSVVNYFITKSSWLLLFSDRFN